MASTVVPLTDHRPGQPDPCRDCVFWQDARRASDPQRKERWSESVRDDGGHWGSVLWEAGEFQGLLQYGPEDRFPRGRVLPAGPPSAGAHLLTCTFLASDDPAGTLERLVLEALADLKARGATAVEAFAARHGGPDDRRARHTLLDRDVLERLGFAELRHEGAVALMRIDVGGLDRGPGLVASLLARLRPRSSPGTVAT